MRTIYVSGRLTDIRVQGSATYYLRFYPDGTFDVFALEGSEIVAIAGIGPDGAITGRSPSLAARRDVFLRDNPQLGSDRDAGCYVDGAQGIYAIDRIVEIAKAHGFEAICPACDAGDPTNVEEHCDHSNELENECDAYMNEYFPVDGRYWGRNDNGDWGLWPIDDGG